MPCRVDGREIHTTLPESGLTHRIRGLFESAVRSEDGEQCPLLWRMYLKFLVRMGSLWPFPSKDISKPVGSHLHLSLWPSQESPLSCVSCPLRPVTLVKPSSFSHFVTFLPDVSGCLPDFGYFPGVGKRATHAHGLSQFETVLRGET